MSTNTKKCSCSTRKHKVKPNKPSAEQVTWLAQLRTQGYFTVVAYSADEAWSTLESYLSGTAPHYLTQKDGPK